MAQVLVPFPGASSPEVEQMVAVPTERMLSQMAGLEHVSSVSRPGLAVLTVQFKVGISRTEALVRLHDTVQSHRDWLPETLGVGAPLIKPKGIEDVPILSLTLFSKDADIDADALEHVGRSMATELQRVPGTREVSLIGGPGRAVRIEVDAARLAQSGLTMADLRQALQGANAALPLGDVLQGGRAMPLDAGPFLSSARDVDSLIVGVRAGKPVFLNEVATVSEGPPRPSRYVWHGQAGREHSAVTLSITKKTGENAIDVANALLRRVDGLRNTVIPAEVEVVPTRNYGATANDKAQKLIQKLLFATVSVVALVYFALGRREAAIVGAAVVLTLTATLFASWAWGFTLNRVSLFALIFSIGILVDDAIVVVENIHRHQTLKPELALAQLIPAAVDEVGGPTILATLTVIAALLPMAFVSGLMGPYMSPIPINASMGMLLSLAIAFIVTPWLAQRWMKPSTGAQAGVHAAKAAEHHGMSAWLAPRFERLFRPLLDAGTGARQRRWLGLGVAGLIALSLALPMLGVVLLKMLPFDNKSEFQVVLNMPAGTPLEDTAAVLHELGAFLARQPEVQHYQAYAGTAAPINFNGLVRQYDLRASSELGDLQVNLVDKAQRHEQSHAIATRLRPTLAAIAKRHGGQVVIAEVPPGPPVLAPIVAEVYGPDDDGRLQLARQVRAVFEQTPGLVDVDDSSIASAPRQVLMVDRRKAALAGVTQAQIVDTLRAGFAGDTATYLREARASATPALLQLAPETQGQIDSLLQLKVRAATGQLIALRELVNVSDTVREQPRYRKDLLPVNYVTADMAGHTDSPLYGMVRHAPRLVPAEGPRRRADRRAFHFSAGSGLPRLCAQVGWRVADHLRNLPRHGCRLCSGPAADLPAGGGAVWVLPDAADHHGPHPADRGGRDAWPCAAGRLLHRHQHDRHDRVGRHHRAQLHLAGGLHRLAASGRHAHRGGHRQRRQHPGPADSADRTGGHDGRFFHLGRPHLQRSGHLADFRHLGLDRVDAGRDSTAVFRRLPRHSAWPCPGRDGPDPRQDLTPALATDALTLNWRTHHEHLANHSRLRGADAVDFARAGRPGQPALSTPVLALAERFCRAEFDAKRFQPLVLDGTALAPIRP